MNSAACEGAVQGVEEAGGRGFQEVLVHNPQELLGLDPSKHAIRIASTVSIKKRLEIVEKALKMGFKVLNPGKRVLELLGLTEAGE